MTKPTVRTTVQLKYELCPDSPFFHLSDQEQADLMNLLLRRVVAIAGGGEVGLALLKKWADFPTPPELVHGHLLSERAAWMFAKARIDELPDGQTYLVTRPGCAGCVPEPPEHLSMREFLLSVAGGHGPLTVSVNSTLGRIECPVYLRMEVATPLQHAPEHQSSMHRSEGHDHEHDSGAIQQKTVSPPAPHEKAPR